LNGSAVVAIALGKVTDGAVVLAVVVINTLIGFFQEFRASRAIEALADMVPENATVLRENQRLTLPVADLVPGDVVALASGDKVPADGRLVTVRNIRIEEAALTGESLPSEKSIDTVSEGAPIGDRTCLVFGGTLVTTGTAMVVLVATGNQTELGKISTLLKQTTDLQTPLTKALESIGKIITSAVLAISLVMVIVGVARMVGAGVPLGVAIRDTLVFAVALAVGAIPEGLPAIVTIALAIGVQRMAQRRAIVRKLPAVETLGSTTTICSDKTGTLTRNEMTVQAVWTQDGMFEVTGVGYKPTGEFKRDGGPLERFPESAQRLLLDGALCNDSTVTLQDGTWRLSGDPTEGALVVAAMKLGIDVTQERQSHPRVDTIPFESENQFMATLHRFPSGEQRIIVKGAPEVVIRYCRDDGGDWGEDEILEVVDQMAKRGMRVLALATKTHPSPLERLDVEHVVSRLKFVGLEGMIDPPRTEAIEAIQACHAAGINVKMITGDHQGTATAIGRQLGLLKDGVAITGSVLETTSDEGMCELVRASHVFARVAPEHKLRLVRALQANGEVVAMTGDGVNDAPALKQSNIGVAMGITGTAVSKEAADIVLIDDNFATIAAAVEEGRRVYDNLIKSLAFVLPTNLGLALILIVAVIAFPFNPVTKELLLPMLPVQLLWINLVATVSLALPLAFEAKELDVMRRPPRSPHEPVLSPFVVYRTLLTAVLMTVGAVGLFDYEYSKDLAAGVSRQVALTEAQTITVTTVVFFQIFYMLNCRSLKGTIFQIGIFSNWTIYVGVAVLVSLQAVFIGTPLFNRVFGSAPIGVRELLLAAFVGASILPVISFEKWWRKRAPKRS
jgi:Ca2+-transporting ATPase